MTYKKMSFLLLLVGGLYMFSGLDMQAQEKTNSEATSFMSNLPLLFKSDNPAKQRVLYGGLLLAASGIYFVSNKRKEIKKA
ncbi:MAG: hypothetical protein KDC34_00050 [Saprospiraceae bacterium]|nr:hypothetical protein [Saprospiraceae bacterium]